MSDTSQEAGHGELLAETIWEQQILMDDRCLVALLAGLTLRIQSFARDNLETGLDEHDDDFHWVPHATSWTPHNSHR